MNQTFKFTFKNLPEGVDADDHSYDYMTEDELREMLNNFLADAGFEEATVDVEQLN